MHGEGFFWQAFVYLTAAVVSVPLSKRLGLGSVLGYLIAGIVIGPFGLGLVGEEGEDVMHFAEFGVVMMLFLIGLELQPSLLWRMRGPVLGLGGLQLLLTATALALVGLLAGLAWQPALAVGLILALSSTAIVLQTMSEKGLLKTDAGQSAFAVLLLQDIAVIPLLALLPLLTTAPAAAAAGAQATGHAPSWVAGLPAWAETLVVLGAVAAIVVGGHFVVRPLFRFIARARLREIFTAAALLLVIAIALLMSRVGLSPALGTFVAGVVLADSEYRHELESDIDPFKGLLLGLFFIAVGASIDFRLIGTQPALVAALVAALVVIKGLLLFLLGRAFKMGLDQNLIFTFILAQSGEFAFVLFSFAQQHQVLSPQLAGLLVAVVALSMALTPLLMLLNERLILPRVGTRKVAGREPDAVDEHNPVLIAGFGRFGNTVGRLLRGNGVPTTVLDHDSDHVDAVRRLGFKVFYGDATRLDLLHAAGAASARLLVLAIDDPDKILEVVHTAKKHFPRLKILARATSRAHAYELLEAGVEQVYRETLDSSLRLGIEALRLLGTRAYQAHRAARTFRQQDEQALRELATMRHDRKAYLNLARQRIQELEETLRRENDRTGASHDAAWDTTSLRREYGQAAKD
jgi:monovalent cation:proton antiporter-2 (CPA2) family protein